MQRMIGRIEADAALAVLLFSQHAIRWPRRNLPDAKSCARTRTNSAKK